MGDDGQLILRGDGDKKLHFGLIGCGKFALKYHVPVLETDSRVQLTVICDVAPSPFMEGLAGRAGARLATHLESILADDVIDAVIISTPHGLHAQHIRCTLDAGKHVLVDKPFVLTVTDADQLSSMAAAKGLTGAVAFNRHFDRGFCYARDAIQAGDLGPIRFVQSVQLGYPRSGWFVEPELGGGGPLVGRVSHFADVVPWMLGSRPQRVRATVEPGADRRTETGGYIDVDFGRLIWRATALSEGCWMWDEVGVYGDSGVLEVQRPSQSLLEWQTTHFNRERTVCRIIEPERAGSATSDFIDAIWRQCKPETTFEDARLSVQLIEAAYESARCDGAWVPV